MNEVKIYILSGIIPYEHILKKFLNTKFEKKIHKK